MRPIREYLKLVSASGFIPTSCYQAVNKTSGALRKRALRDQHTVRRLRLGSTAGHAWTSQPLALAHESTACVVFVEPWLTPFLRLVHWVSENPLARRLSKKMDALATMIHHERTTYEQWLSQPQLIRKMVRTHFVPVHESFASVKWNFACTPQ